jgi:hypothetical protein
MDIVCQPELACEIARETAGHGGDTERRHPLRNHRSARGDSGEMESK